MRFEMSTGDHKPEGQHFVVLDNRGRLMDLSGINGTLHDPTMTKVTWGLVTQGADTREGGTIFRVNGPPQAFFDMGVLKPYLDAFRAAEAADDAEAEKASIEAGVQGMSMSIPPQ